MLTRRFVSHLVFGIAACLMLALTSSLVQAGSADGCGCSCGCGPSHHCPKTVFCVPKRPNLKFKRVCPKPVCNPCDLDNYGYYDTCWHPWPFPPNYSHCVLPPASALADGMPLAGDPSLGADGAPLAMPGMMTPPGSRVPGAEPLGQPRR